MDLDLHERLKNKFAVLNVPMPTNAELIHIFGSILNQHLLNFGEHIKVLGENVHKITRLKTNIDGLFIRKLAS